MHVLPLSDAVTGMHMHYVNVRKLVLRSAGRPVAKFRCEQCTADRHDSSKCRSGTQERELRVQLVIFSSASFLMRYYFALFSTKTSECSVSPPTFLRTLIVAGLSSCPLYAFFFFVKSAVICVRAHDLVPTLYDEYQWNVLRKVYIGMPMEFRCLLYRCKLFIGLWCVDLICPIGLCVFTVPKLISTSFSQRSVKPILRRPVNCDNRVLTTKQSPVTPWGYSAALVGAWPFQQCQYDKHADGKWQRTLR
jgi:hypothetical protein